MLTYMHICMYLSTYLYLHYFSFNCLCRSFLGRTSKVMERALGQQVLGDVYVCVYVCVCVCVCIIFMGRTSKVMERALGQQVLVNVCMYECMYVSTSTVRTSKGGKSTGYIHIQTYRHTYIHTQTSKGGKSTGYIHIQTYIHTYIHTYTNIQRWKEHWIYTYTDIHTYIHT